MKVGRVGVRDERHGAGMGNEKPNSLGSADVFGYSPSR